jgi:hypothetical protein
MAQNIRAVIIKVHDNAIIIIENGRKIVGTNVRSGYREDGAGGTTGMKMSRSIVAGNCSAEG